MLIATLSLTFQAFCFQHQERSASYANKGKTRSYCTVLTPNHQNCSVPWEKYWTCWVWEDEDDCLVLISSFLFLYIYQEAHEQDSICCNNRGVVLKLTCFWKGLSTVQCCSVPWLMRGRNKTPTTISRCQNSHKPVTVTILTPVQHRYPGHRLPGVTAHRTLTH